MEERKLISVNINGLNSTIKRKRVFHKLEKLKVDIICLQEVHIKRQYEHLLKQPKLGKLFATLTECKQRGVILYIKETISAELIYRDDDGRILMVEIFDNNIKILLIAIYAPNDNQEEFYRKLHSKITELDYANICMMGDFNGIINHKMDYKTQKTIKKIRKPLPRSFFQMTEEMNLKDAWRERNMEKKQYTFYSSRHASWSRIDMIWISTELIDKIHEIEIETNIWADHNPMMLTWKGQKRRPRWTLNNAILKEKDFQQKIEKELAFFFKENRKEDTSLQNLWDTMKAYIRGLIMEYTGKRYRQQKKTFKVLENDYKILEKELQKTPQKKEIKVRMDLIKHKIGLMEKEELAQKIRNSKQNFFEDANKPGRWLAYKLRKERESRKIIRLKNEQGDLCYRNDEKKIIVQDYYSKLYDQEKISEEKIKQYLQEAKLPLIPKDIDVMLEENITMMELTEALKKQNNGKAPGPDGLPAEFYKTFQDALSLQLLEVMNEVMLKQKIPETWLEAYITLIPKEDTDPQQVKNYRPISLLNSDYKIFASILAERLKKYLNNFIHSDQNGFLPKRHINNNMRIILDTLEYYEAHPEKQVALMFLDAQKAFDNVSWRFILLQLEWMGFGEKFVRAIETIYTKQMAKVMVNGELTDIIKVKKGTRQGCPLSPLLFVLTLEVLNRQIREDKEIKGLKIKKQEYKLQAFADDLVFIMEDPLKTAPKLLKKIEEYGEVAGLKINKDKTKILSKNMSVKQKKDLEEVLKIQVTNKVKYLGIYITARCSTLKEDNYLKLKQQIATDLTKWGNLQLSLVGRISTIKMNVLPRILYLFQTIPIKLGKEYFEDLNKIILKYIWQGKKARIKLKLLQDVRLRGGFALPNWELYYQAACLMWVKEWIMLRNSRLLTLEGHDLLLGWHAFLWYKGTKTQGYFRRHYIREALLLNWEKTKKQYYLKIPLWLSTIEAFTYPIIYKEEQTVRYREILNEKGELKSMQALQEQGMKMNWYSYVQIQSRFNEDLKTGGFYDKLTDLDKILTGTDEKMIKKLYGFLLEIKMEEEQVKETMIAWGKNFGHGIDLEEWQMLWSQNYKMTMSTAFKENLYKMFYRWHLPPARIARMFKDKSEKCWKCHQTPGTYYHMWWTCAEAQKYWTKIHTWLEKMIKQHIDFKPEIFLLGIIPETYNKELKYLIVNILTAARIVFAKNWKNEKTPMQEEVIKKIMDCAEMSKLTFEIREQEDKQFYRIWDLFYQWLEEKI